MLQGRGDGGPRGVLCVCAGAAARRPSYEEPQRSSSSVPHPRCDVSLGGASSSVLHETLGALPLSLSLPLPLALPVMAIYRAQVVFLVFAFVL